MLIPLHVKSHYSLGLGTASVREVVTFAAHEGLPALALTDVENLYGQMEFHHACAERDIHAISGVELREGFDGRRELGSRSGRVVLLARDEAGYRNLCRIVSARRVRAGTTSPLAAGEDPVRSLRGHTEGLLVLTDDPDTARRILEEGVAPREAVRLLLVRPRAAEVSMAAREMEVPLVADPDAVMLRSDDHPLHELLLAIRRNEDVATIRERGLAEPRERALGSADQLDRLFADRPEAVAETARIARQCSLDLRQRPRQLPPRVAASEATAEEALAARCRASVKARREQGEMADAGYPERLERELNTVANLGFSSYFLTVSDIVRAAEERGIRTWGRGSAAGSLISFLLGITQVDPVAAGLYFERFLHPGRADPPDIDLDVDSRRRHELIRWIRRTYGRERVAMVSAHQTFRRRSALREGLRALGMAPSAVATLMHGLPSGAEGEAWSGEEPGAVEAMLPPRFRSSLPLLRRLIGTPSHVSVHPAGLVIAPVELSSVVPLERSSNGVVVTQYDLRSVEAAGLLKIDLLGSRALAEVDETLELAGRPLEPIPDDDPETLAAIDRGDTIGCFQLESPAVRSILRQIPVRGLEDLVAALAVVRPGAASGRAKRSFIRRARGIEETAYLHPDVEERMRPTHGLPLYEEDIIFLLHTLGGVPVSEADELRAAIVRAGERTETLDRLGRAFVQRARTQGRDGEAARSAWGTAGRFAAYSFSKAHAASFALLAYRTAYFRTHAPAEFGSALLNNYGGMYPLRTIAAELVRRGIPVEAPSVVRSARATGVERLARGPSVRLGLSAIKHLRRASVDGILEARAGRTFQGLSDLLRRVRLDAGELRALVLSGACDELHPLTAAAYPVAHEALLARRSPGNAASLFEARSDQSATRKWRILVRIRNELQYLAMHPSAHPLAVLREDARAAGCVPIADLPEHENEPVRVAAALAASRRVRSRTGGAMQFATLEDEGGTVEAVVFPPTYHRVGRGFTTSGPYLVDGRLTIEYGDPQLVVDDLRPFIRRGTAAPRGRERD